MVSNPVDISKFAVGERFPAPAPQQEGAVMELWHDNLAVIIQFPGLSDAERMAFQVGFKRYAYLETGTSVPIVSWIFNFPSPHNPVDCNFNARVVDRGSIKNYIDPADGVHPNIAFFYLLDGQILRAVKMVGLHDAAVSLFQATIRKQLAANFSQSDYDQSLSELYRYDPRELFRMGRSFKMHGS